MCGLLKEQQRWGYGTEECGGVSLCCLVCTSSRENVDVNYLYYLVACVCFAGGFVCCLL